MADRARVGVFGQRGSGKSAYLAGYCGGARKPARPTCGVELFPSAQNDCGEPVDFVEFGGDFAAADSYRVFLQIFAGEREGRAAAPPFDAVLFFFDVRYRASLLQAREWLLWLQRELRGLCARGGEPAEPLLAGARPLLERALATPVLFVANKLDLLVEESQLRLGEYLDRGQHPKLRESFAGVFRFLDESFGVDGADNVVFASSFGAARDFEPLRRLENVLCHRRRAGAAPQSARLLFDLDRAALRNFLCASVGGLRGDGNLLRNLVRLCRLRYFE